MDEQLRWKCRFTIEDWTQNIAPYNSGGLWEKTTEVVHSKIRMGV